MAALMRYAVIVSPLIVYIAYLFITDYDFLPTLIGAAIALGASATIYAFIRNRGE